MRSALYAAGLAVCVGTASHSLWSTEGEPAPLVRYLPADIDAALRCEGAGLADHRVARAAGIDEKRIAEIARALAGAAGPFDAREVVRAVLGCELVASTRDGELLVLTRLSRYGRALVDGALASRGEPVEDESRSIRRVKCADGAAWFAARDRDVLAVSTDATLLRESLACASQETSSASPPFGEAFGASTRIARTVEAWSRGEFAADCLRAVADDGPASVLLEALSLDELKSLGACVNLDEHGASLRWTIDRGDCGAADLETLAAPDAPPTDDLLALARSLAPPRESMLVAGARVSAREALQRYFAALPERVEPPAGEGNATDALATLCHDGAAFVVARLEETDSLDVECLSPDATEVVAGSLVALRLRGAGDAEAATRVLGALFPNRRPLDGATLFAKQRCADDGPRWTLLRPAAAVAGDLLVLSSHEPLLVRALATRTSADWLAAPIPPRAGDDALRAEIDFRRLFAFAADLRGGAGRAARPPRSASLRRAVVLHLQATRAESGSALDALVDAETARLSERRDLDAFRAAVDAHRARISPLAELDRGDVSLRVEGAVITLRVGFRLR